ncbi:MAG: flagellar hook basal-body protein [Chloroflexota bacterium]
MSSSLFHTLHISRQDLLNRLLDLDVVSNNLANMNTAGFKASRSNFQELLHQRTLEGVTLASTQGLMQQGALRNSANPLDWAIQGKGFFQVRLPDGSIGYTRDGQFLLDSSRQLVTAAGYRLVWNGQIPDGTTDVYILPDGSVQATLQDGTRLITGQVQLARFVNPSGLIAQGHNVWLASEASGAAQVGTPGTAGFGMIAAHAVEQSNVDLSTEMTRLMSLQRSFQMSVRTFQQTDTMIAQALTLRKG